MKKLFSLIVMIMAVCMAAEAQTASFLGIPIEGNFRDFGKKLQSKGYTLIDASDEGDIYEGVFTGKDVWVNVQPGINNQLAMVGIYLPSQPTWQNALDQFGTYCNIYTNKYGSADITDRESGTYTVGSSAFKNALENGDVLYRNIYIVDDIFISITITNTVTEDTEGYQVLILYINDNNYMDADDYSDEI